VEAAGGGESESLGMIVLQRVMNFNPERVFAAVVPSTPLARSGAA
jgi:hypothetical protein